MRDFFSSGKFKILIALLAVIVASMFVTAYLGGRSSPVNQALGLITVPLQKLSSSISGAASGFFERYLRADRLYEENQELRGEIETLRGQLVDYEEYKRENEHYKAILGLKEQNPDFEFLPAEVVNRDPNDVFFGFTIDKGTMHGVAAYDPVLTSAGLVGWVSEVGLNYAKVTTILDVAIDVGAVDTRTRDSGVVTGEAQLARLGLCKLGYLTRESAVTSGDIIMTSGIGSVFGVVFPKGLIIGTVTEVRAESNGIVLYGVVEPAADITEVKDVFILTAFPGQGIPVTEGEDDGGAQADSAQEPSSAPDGEAEAASPPPAENPAAEVAGDGQ